MPEVNEVRKYADFIKDHIKNKDLEEIKILKGRYKTHGPFSLYKDIEKELPLKILDVQTKGKFTYISLEKDYYIFCTLGLSGGWLFKDNDNKYHYADQNYGLDHTKNALNHLNVEFKFNTGFVYFFDQMSLGTLKVIKGKKDLDKKLNALGPDIMDLNTTFVLFKEKIKKQQNLNKPIGNVLMNQKIISGIGNYLRADTLWMSKISPFRKVTTLTDGELMNIYKNTRALTWGEYDKKKGLELKIISKKAKLPSDYDRDFFIYRQDTDIHGNKIEKDELYEGSQKRFIYWVPTIQK